MQMILRDKPCLCISCPICGSVFMATALNSKYHNDHDANQELLNEIAEYATKGYDVSFEEANNFMLNYCEHIKPKP